MLIYLILKIALLEAYGLFKNEWSDDEWPDDECSDGRRSDGEWSDGKRPDGKRFMAGGLTANGFMMTEL